MSDIVLLTRQQVEKILGIKRSTLYRWVLEGRLIKPIQMSPGCVRWSKTELEDWINSRPKATGHKLPKLKADQLFAVCEVPPSIYLNSGYTWHLYLMHPRNLLTRR